MLSKFHARRLVYLSALSMTLLPGCGPSHYTIKQDNSVSFYLKHAEAEKVIFACSIDRYQYHTATPVGAGLWKITILPPPEFAYFYIVDGVVTVPDCELAIDDDFGSRSCLYIRSM
jgi:hypothetical protein